jgi:Ca2+/H+ antiporter
MLCAKIFAVEQHRKKTKAMEKKSCEVKKSSNILLMTILFVYLLSEFLSKYEEIEEKKVSSFSTVKQ